MIVSKIKLHTSPALWPERRSVESILQLKKVTPRTIFESTYQQNDAISFGSVFPRYWWSYYQYPGMALPPVFEMNEEGDLIERPLVTLPREFSSMIESWDLSFSEKKTAAYNVGQVWGKVGASSYLLDMVRGQWDMPTVTRKVKDLADKWPRARPILIENKANGPAVIQTLRATVPGIIGINPDSDKVSRAHAVTVPIEAGNIYLPHPDLLPWVNEFLDEVSLFPTSEYKDVVDTMTQALSRLYSIATRKRGATRPKVITTG